MTQSNRRREAYVPTRIVFTFQRQDGRPQAVNVAESPDDVLTGFLEAQGQPFVLERLSSGEEIYVNPNIVAFFEEAAPAAAAAPPAAAPTE
jgi:hypothetical protein